jgi:hypothetical protein
MSAASGSSREDFIRRGLTVSQVVPSNNCAETVSRLGKFLQDAHLLSADSAQCCKEDVLRLREKQCRDRREQTTREQFLCCFETVFIAGQHFLRQLVELHEMITLA